MYALFRIAMSLGNAPLADPMPKLGPEAADEEEEEDEVESTPPSSPVGDMPTPASNVATSSPTPLEVECTCCKGM